MHHMCEENRLALSALKTKSEAIALYKKTIDWALEEGYPTLATLESCFGDCGDEGVFVDRTFNGEVLDEAPVYVFHNCKGEIKTGLNVREKNIPMLYFANGCDMRVSACGPEGIATCIPLYIFGPNKVRTQSDSDAVFRIYKTKVK